MSFVNGYLSRDSKKAGGDVKFWKSKPAKGKDGVFKGKNQGTAKEPNLESPLFNMTEESFIEDYDKEFLPKVGGVNQQEFEI